MPRCKHCKSKFEAKTFNQKYCKETEECREAFAEYKLSVYKKIREKESKAEVKKMKEGLLTHKDYLKMLQTVFNKFIRERDKDKPCVSCGVFKAEEFHAGHYIPSTFTAVRFNELNVWKQCSKCNTHLRGNQIAYREELVKRIGLDRVGELEAKRHDKLKLSVPEIKELIKEYKQKIKDLR